MPHLRLMVLVHVLCLSLSQPAASQVTPVNTFPRNAERLLEVVALEEARSKSGLTPDSIEALDEALNRIREGRSGGETGGINWTRFNEEGAARFWQAEDVTLLSAATLSPGEESTSLFTELATVLTGPWRVALGTTLAVGSQERDSDSAVGPDGASQSDSGFRRFIAGGGNVSLTGFRPIGMGNASSSSHLLLVIPRAWANVPALSPVDGVDSFGGELAAEYQYHRYQSEWVNDSLQRQEVPFLTVHGRVAVATGPSAFHRTIGRTASTPLAYIVPSLNMNFPNGIRFGASYFYGFGSLRQHEDIRIHITLAPIGKGEETEQ